jgi:hypothetical protein
MLASKPEWGMDAPKPLQIVFDLVSGIGSFILLIPLVIAVYIARSEQ